MGQMAEVKVEVKVKYIILGTSVGVTHNFMFALSFLHASYIWHVEIWEQPWNYVLNIIEATTMKRVYV